MNDTSLKYIRKMLMQMLKELGIVSSINGILNSVYGKDYDASCLINRIGETHDGIFDILNKDATIRTNSAEAVIYALHHLKISTTSYNTYQLTGLCVFVQFILICGRSEFEGFGSVTNLVAKWKLVDRQKKMLKNQRIIDEQNKLAVEAQKLTSKLAAEKEELEKKRLEEENMKLEPEDILDSWEDIKI
tara:strand:- start:2257 stop:2823 length:567 start_codon:yes stop_codon:yes gene_type:complete